MATQYQAIWIEHVYPELDSGRYPVKREVGDALAVSAEIFKDGHDKLACFLLHRPRGARKFQRTRMSHEGYDRWSAEVTLSDLGLYEYTLYAYLDFFASWRDELRKKHEAGVDLSSELLEGKRFVEEARLRAPENRRNEFDAILAKLDPSESIEEAVFHALSDSTAHLMDQFPDESVSNTYDRVLEVVVERVEARYAAWYEFFPRSQGTDPTRSATFAECEKRIPEIQAMGFNVLYLPPIHPIGETNRKGANNALVAQAGEPGCPYAIGSRHGGHKAVEPGLGTLDDFDHLVRVCANAGIEIALDFAVNCSPDHPYVQDHPEWFNQRPDGTIKYSENPPKKYEDIYGLNFHCKDWKALWEELKSVIEFWIGHGVKIFRVDNPHTKPIAFWQWMIRDVQAKHPDTLFLAEAFTRPSMMKVLGKTGFSQSYTYFTWRNFKHEITEYFTELTQGEMQEYYRGNLFPTTPDILPTFLQEGGQAAFKIRLALAATLSSVYGMYSGYELCEGRGIPGKEEYIDSEKYQYKVWDWNRPGNIKAFVTRINEIRRNNPALHEYNNLEFYAADNESILFYGKRTPDNSNMILVVINLDPFQTQHSYIHVPIELFDIDENEIYQAHDLITDQRFLWQGRRNYVEIKPQEESVHLFAIRRWLRRENDFDYFSM